jgi:hypothetical protein
MSGEFTRIIALKYLLFEAERLSVTKTQHPRQN